MTTIKLRRSTAAEWTTANTILAAGEMGIETDTRKFKFGDGTTPWNTLAYASAEGGGGTGSGTLLTSEDGSISYDKLALGDTLSVIDTSIKELNGVTQTGGTLNSELEFTGGSGAYLKMNEKYNLSTANSWEFQIKYKHNGGGSFPTIFGYASGTDFKTPAFILENGSLKLYLSSDGYSWNLNSNNSGLVPISGTIYYFKIGFTGSQYYIKYNTTGWSDDFTTQWTLNSTTKVYCSDYFMLMNLSLNSNYYNNGTIYLQDTALLINEAEVWRGVNIISGLLTLNANLDNIPQPNLFKTPLANSIFDITNVSDLPIGETIINTSFFPTDNVKPYFGILKDDGSSWFVGINPGNSNLFRVGYDKMSFFPLYKTYKVKIILNKISNTEIYAKGILYNSDNTTVLLESGSENVSSGKTFQIYNYHTLNSNWISLAYDNSTLKVNDSGQLYADIQTKQDILSDGNGTKVVDNKVDIYQGTDSIQGLNLYQNNGTITKNDDLSIIFNNGACGYIFLENKGVNNDYEIVLHQIYLNTHGPGRDSSINGVRCLPRSLVPTPGEGAKGECWFDTYDSPFRVVAIPNGGSAQIRTVDNINYIKYVIKGTNMTISYSSTGEAYTELYTIAISSTYVINVCIANSPWQKDIASKWTNTVLFPDSYILDKTTNIYLMKQGTSNEGVAVATSSKYGLVLPDNSTIVSNNGVMSVVPSTIAGYGMPSNRYIDLTPGAGGTSYTAPADGWITFVKKITATGQYVVLSNNTTSMSIMGCNASDAPGSNTSCFIPCKKGDEVATWYTAGGDVITLRFIYAEGVQ